MRTVGLGGLTGLTGLTVLTALTMAGCGTPPTLAAARVTTPVMVGPVKYLGPTAPEKGTQPDAPITVEVYQSAISWVMPSSSENRKNSMTVSDVEKASKVDTEIIRATKMDDAYDVHVDRIHTRGRYWNAIVVSKTIHGGQIEGRVVSVAGGETEESEAPETPAAPPATEEELSEPASTGAPAEGTPETAEGSPEDAPQ